MSTKKGLKARSKAKQNPNPNLRAETANAVKTGTKRKPRWKEPTTPEGWQALRDTLRRELISALAVLDQWDAWAAKRRMMSDPDWLRSS